MSTYNAIEPTVIDEDLLRKAVNDQAAPEIADVARREGIDPSDVTCLRLDYKNILKIDNLWMFENLTKLQLDNNIIEQIEKINFLKNLQWLDLSFNNITKIEGLEGLTRLTDLTLYNNRITKLENLDDLVNLNVLSLGNNQLSVLENVNYLSKFESLRVLNLSGNSICKHANYRHYILAHIRGLRYLDYRLVDDESVGAAKEQYIDDIIAQEEEDKVAAARREQDRRDAEQAALYDNSHIPGLDVLFPTLFSEDPDFARFSALITPDPFHDLRDEYGAKVGVVVNELRHFVLKRAAEKGEEYDAFARCLKEAQGKIDAECWAGCKAFNANKKKQISQIQQSNNQSEILSLFQNLRDGVQQLSDTLISHEMTLVEQFEEVLKEFERNYTEMSSSINETAASSFARLRELENEFHERLSEAVLAAVDRFIKGDIAAGAAAAAGEIKKDDKEGGGVLDQVEDELRDIIGDKDVLVNAINSSHDFRLGKFDHQEDTLVTGVARDLETIIQKTHELEVTRNRDRVCEIIAFLDKSSADIDVAEENAY
ncbi:Dynein regulatory complex subunit 3 [Thoreauomyces humboldtii]|nr:Dynein regulatory complex subunit 3 [Thoreauomyces humboldtii]